jgi:aminopeptidase Y
MLKLLLIAQAASIALCQSHQIPLQAPNEIVEQSSKPVINSTELQALITAKSLLSRAETLFTIAETSEKEFGHPTRVIGSAG